MIDSVVFFDTETTSLNEDREIIEAAWIRLPVHMTPVDFCLPRGARPSCLRFKPARPLGFGAMAINHILPHELEKCPPSSSFVFPEGAKYVVGHSVDFDWEAAGKPEVLRICTKALAEHIWPEADSHSQSALLYMLQGATEETRESLRGAHGAATDVYNNAVLMGHILSARPEIKTWAALWECSEKSRIPLRMPITKAKGMLLTEIDDGLLGWCLRQSWLREEHPYLYTGLRNERERRWGGKSTE